MRRRWACLAVLGAAVSAARADDLLYRYECIVLPYDARAGWLDGNPCEWPCSESLEDGHFVLRWGEYSELAIYYLPISTPKMPPPPDTLWVEWRLRSNNPIPLTSFTCDAWFVIKFGGMFEGVNLFADAAVSDSGDQFILGLSFDEFHSFRYECLDGVNYQISVDGEVFIVDADNRPNGYHSLRLGGQGGCTLDIPERVSEWDFVRYGTISYGEQIVDSDPRDGFLDARRHVGLDRFTVTYDSPNYAYIDEITVATTAGVTPEVIATRRLDNGAPEVLEVVLDQPISLNATTRFTFDDGAAVNVIEYTFAPADTDGDGRVSLSDIAYLQTCFGTTDPIGPCLPLDLDTNGIIDLADFDELLSHLDGP